MKNFLRKHRYLVGIFLLMTVSILASFIFADQVQLFDRAFLETFLIQAGYIGPLVLIGAVAIEVIIAPIPGGVPPIVAGALFGIEGLLYVWLGNVLGSTIAFWLARWFGLKLVLKIDRKFDQHNYLQQVQKLWIFYFIPLMPVDILSFAMGLSQVKFRAFFTISSIGFLVSMGLLTLFGDSLANLLF